MGDLLCKFFFYQSKIYLEELFCKMLFNSKKEAFPFLGLSYLLSNIIIHFSFPFFLHWWWSSLVLPLSTCSLFPLFSSPIDDLWLLLELYKKYIEFEYKYIYIYIYKRKVHGKIKNIYIAILTNGHFLIY